MGSGEGKKLRIGIGQSDAATKISAKFPLKNRKKKSAK
jgi:hypothetical protein